jgi:thermitase
LLGRGKALEMFTNLGYVRRTNKAFRVALIVALGATLAALAAVALVVASGAAVGQQQGQVPQESSAELWGAPQPEQSTERDFAPAERVVGLNEGVTNSTQGLEQAAEASGGRVVERLDDPKNSAVLLKFPTEQAAQAAADGLAKRPDVQYVERNGIVEGHAVSSDADVGLQWHHTVIRKTADLGTLPSAPPTIAVVDSGVDYNHPDLSGKVIKGPDYVNNDSDPMDDVGHGTHVAGIAAATAGNGQFGEGVSPNSKILAIKVLNSSNQGTDFNLAQGLAYARNANTTPATRVINASLGGYSAPGTPSGQLIAEEVAAIKAAGKILVASAGNSNTSVTPSYPGSDPNTALRVTATEQNDCRALFSNFSPASNPTFYNIAAPGDNIYSLIPFSFFPNNGWRFADGTSMASPMVAGAAALVWGKTPSLTRGQVVTKLVSTGEKTSCGFAAPTPRLDVRKALLGTSETAIVGQLLDPDTGRAPGLGVPPATAKLFSGTTLLKSDAINESGFYEMTGLTAGTGRTLKATRSGSVSGTLRNGISIVDGKVTGPSTDALPEARDTGNATLTVDWKTAQPKTDTEGCMDACNGWDFYLRIMNPSGVDASSGPLTEPPFTYFRRDFSFNEGIPLQLGVIGSQAVDGTYKVVVQNSWRGDSASLSPVFNPSWTGSQASVQISNGAAPLATQLGGGLKKVPSTCGTTLFWYAGDLTKSGTSYSWTSKNLCTNTEP